MFLAPFAQARQDTGSVPKKQSSQFYIEDKKVTEVAFNKLLKSLTEIEGTWYCAETTTGGRTGYRAKDKQGKVYVYTATTDNGKTISTLKKKAEPGEK